MPRTGVAPVNLQRDVASPEESALPMGQQRREFRDSRLTFLSVSWWCRFGVSLSVDSNYSMESRVVRILVRSVVRVKGFSSRSTRGVDDVLGFNTESPCPDMKSSPLPGCKAAIC